MRRPHPIDQQSYAYDHHCYNNPHLLDYHYFNHYQQFNRKRQRRQAAAIVVESIWNNGSSNNDTSGNTTPTRKSTAQPRPVLTIPPRGIGPIADPNVNDVLCGRGGRINSHAGNVHFRDVIHSKKKEYLAPTTKKLEKAHIAAGIVNDIRTMNPPGRFLKEEKGTGMWYDIGDAKAIKKTGQALREDAPDIRPVVDVDVDVDVDGGSSGDEKKPGTSKRPDAAGKSKGHSPHVSPRTHRGNTIIDEQQHNMAPILPQHQGYNDSNAQQQISPPDHQGQMAMPPPYMMQGNNNGGYSSRQLSQQQQFMQHQASRDQHGFETRNIPIQLPVQSFPRQVYAGVPSGVQSATNKYNQASRRAMEALSQTGPTVQHQYTPYIGSERQHNELPFGMAFHDPVNPRMMSDDITISTISGLSEPVSSMKSSRVSGTGNSDLMNMSLKSNISLTDSLRLKSSFRGSSSSQRTFDPLMPPGGSGRSGSFKGYDPMNLTRLNGSIKSFGGSLTRSNSFPDNMNNSDTWTIEDNLEGDPYDRSLAHRSSSQMSIGSIMDLQSNASSGQWFQAAVGNLPIPDDKSFVSSAMMSTDLDALDLAF